MIITNFFEIVESIAALLSSGSLIILTFYAVLAGVQTYRRSIISKTIGFMALLVSSFILMKLL